MKVPKIIALRKNSVNYTVKVKISKKTQTYNIIFLQPDNSFFMQGQRQNAPIRVDHISQGHIDSSVTMS